MPGFTHMLYHRASWGFKMSHSRGLTCALQRSTLLLRATCWVQTTSRIPRMVRFINPHVMLDELYYYYYYFRRMSGVCHQTHTPPPTTCH